MKLATLATRLDERLDTDGFADIDGSPNGLQVGDAQARVDGAAFAVDAAAATIADAASADADLLVTHHGLWWNGTERLTGRDYDRVAALVEDDVALYVSHLPLDAHPELGNAAGVARALDLEELAPFGQYGDRTVGRRGRLPDALSFETFVEAVERHVTGEAGEVRTVPFGPGEVEGVAIVTGSGGDFLDEAVDAGADVLLTGEGKQRLYHEAREEGINLVFAGHYASETFGVAALAELVEEWGVETTMIDHPMDL